MPRSPVGRFFAVPSRARGGVPALYPQPARLPDQPAPSHRCSTKAVTGDALPPLGLDPVEPSYACRGLVMGLLGTRRVPAPATSPDREVDKRSGQKSSPWNRSDGDR